MKKSDVAKVLAIFSATYPSFELTKDRSDLWWSIFKDDEPDRFMEAARRFIRENTSGFAPIPAQILELFPRRKTSTVRTQEQRAADKKRIFNRIKADYALGLATIREDWNEREAVLYTVPLSRAVQIGTWTWDGETIPRFGLLA